MKQSISELIMLADILDASGFIKEAEEIDGIIYKVSAVQPRNINDFVEDLKTALTTAAQSKEVFPNITENSIPEILKVIDVVLQHGQYFAPDISDTRLEETMDYSKVLVDQVLALTDNIKKVEFEMASEQNDAIKRQLLTELHKFSTDLSNLHKEIEKLRSSDKIEDKQKYDKFLNFYLERTGHSYEKA
jgi:transcription initiation factor IIE alpha subunit